MTALLAIAVGLVSVVVLTRRCWDKTTRRSSVIGSQLSPRRAAPEDLP